ncbi:MAG TPA: menaquinone biosynthesis protein [Syntrophobacteria bacterium]|nr:menaquinone biosynthesis protein [Syntrophobacteria bacterium]
MSQSSCERLRLGKIGFLNVLPIYYPLESGIINHPFAIASGTPAHLNALMAKGDLDLSVVSSIEYARYPERYSILPDLSISCCGAVKSVVLFSQVPVSGLDGKTVTVTNNSATSVFLLKILFSERLGIKADLRSGSFEEVSLGGSLPLAFLAIGDEALRLSARDVYPHRLDLGEAWHSWTGLPFVFALWVMQKKSAEKWDGSLENIIKVLASAKDWGRTHLDRVCAVAAQKGILGADELKVYYTGLRFDLREGEQEGLKLFYRFLKDMGEIPIVPELEILAPLARVA